MKGRTVRLAAVVGARRTADQARLAACLAEQNRLRARAVNLMAEVRTAPAGEDAADMALTARWQGSLRATARAALVKAAAMEEDARKLRAQLARSLGREKAVEALAEAERVAVRRRAERRADDMPPPESGNGPGQPSPPEPPSELPSPPAGASSVGMA